MLCLVAWREAGKHFSAVHLFQDRVVRFVERKCEVSSEPMPRCGHGRRSARRSGGAETGGRR